jgi:hypothetical protein
MPCSLRGGDELLFIRLLVRARARCCWHGDIWRCSYRMFDLLRGMGMEAEQMIDQEQQELHLFASRWAQWHCQCRRWAPPVPANILARMQPSKVREAPETELSADLSYFNLAVLAQEECTGKRAFYIFYLLPGANIKVAADYLGVSRNTFYKTLKTFRARAYRSYRAMMLGQPVVVEEMADCE